RMGEPGGDLDLAQEARRPEGRGQLRTEDFEGDPPAVFAIVGQINGRHAPTTELPSDRVELGKSDLKAVCWTAHRRKCIAVSQPSPCAAARRRLANRYTLDRKSTRLNSSHRTISY